MALRASFIRASGKSNAAKASTDGDAQALRHAKRMSSVSSHDATSVTSGGGSGISSDASPMPATTTCAPPRAWTGISLERTSLRVPSADRYSNSSDGNHSTPSRSGRTR